MNRQILADMYPIRYAVHKPKDISMQFNFDVFNLSRVQIPFGCICWNVEMALKSETPNHNEHILQKKLHEILWIFTY